MSNNYDSSVLQEEKDNFFLPTMLEISDLSGSVKEWFFYFNHFSLIIFYHSVWLGFELFGLRVQVFSQLVQFTLVCKGYDNHHCHNKPPDRKWGWSVDDTMPGRDGLRIWRILKKIQLRSDHGVEKMRSAHWGWHWTILADRWVLCHWSIKNWVFYRCGSS